MQTQMERKSHRKFFRVSYTKFSMHDFRNAVHWMDFSVHDCRSTVYWRKISVNICRSAVHWREFSVHDRSFPCMTGRSQTMELSFTWTYWQFHDGDITTTLKFLALLCHLKISSMCVTNYSFLCNKTIPCQFRTFLCLELFR
jgi:hypothetical protein